MKKIWTHQSVFHGLALTSIAFFSIFSLSTAQAKAPATTLNNLFWESPDPGHMDSLKNQYIKSPADLGNLGTASCYRKKTDANVLGATKVESIDYCYINSFLAAVFYHTHTNKDNLRDIMITVIGKYGTSDARIDKDEMHVTSWRDVYNPDYIASVQYNAMDDSVEIMEANEKIVAQSIKEKQISDFKGKNKKNPQ
jgi:hypothetical protein